MNDSKRVRIRITKEPRIGKQHGLTVGREMEAITSFTWNDEPIWYVLTDIGASIGVYQSEAEEI